MKNLQLKYQLLFILAMVLLCYVNTFNHEYSLDDFLMSENLPPIEEGWSGIFGVFAEAYNFFDYRPIAIFTYAIERQLQGELIPGTSHIVNTFFYLLCCLVLFFTLRKLPVKHADTIAFFTTLLFAAHPIHSNVVSSIKNRDIILSLTLGLSSIYLALQSILYEHEKISRNIGVKLLYMFGALVVFLIATTAKLDAVSYLILLPATFFIFSKKRMWLIYSGVFGLVAYQAFRFIRFRIITPNLLQETTVEESILITENNMVMDDTITDTISSALVTLFYYLKFHIIPTGYYFYFGFNTIPVDELWTWQNMLAAATALAGLVAFIYWFKRRPEISYGLAFFFGGLLYCLNVYTPIAGIVAPRLAFIASVGFCMLLAIAILKAGPYLDRKFIRGRTGVISGSWILLAIFLAVYVPYTIDRNRDWKDLFTLLDTDIPHLEDSFEAQRIACMNYVEKSKWVNSDQEALALLGKALNNCTLASKVYSENQFIEETIPLANFKMGKVQLAVSQFKQVLERFDTSELASEYLGDYYVRTNNLDSAIYHFNTLMHIAPDYYLGYFKYNQSMAAVGRVEEAIAKNIEFAEDYPEYFFALEGLGYLNLLAGDTVKAVNSFYIARDRGSQNENYINALGPYLQNTGRTELWQRLENGERLPLE